MPSDQSDIIRWEIDYRRQKQWNIFSWCSALLVATIGGTIALRTGFFSKPPTAWNVYLKSVVTFAVVVLVLYTWSWIHHSDKKEKQALAQLESLELDEATKDLLSWKRWSGWKYSSRVVVALLGLAAILATWVPI